MPTREDTVAIIKNALEEIEREARTLENLIDGDASKPIKKDEIEDFKARRLYFLNVVMAHCVVKDHKKFKKYHKMGNTYFELLKDYQVFMKALLARLEYIKNEVVTDAVLDMFNPSPEKEIERLYAALDKVKETLKELENKTSSNQSDIDVITRQLNNNTNHRDKIYDEIKKIDRRI